MNPTNLTVFISAIAALISNEVTDDNEFAIWALAITRLGNTLTSISAQRALIKKAKASGDSGKSVNTLPSTSCKAPSDNPQ